MSLSAISSLTSFASLQPLSAKSSASTANQSISEASSTGSFQSAVAKETTVQVKGAADGNVTGPQADIAKLSKDLKAAQSAASTGLSDFYKPPVQSSSELSAVSASEPPSTPPNYSVQSGSSTGSVVDASA